MLDVQIKGDYDVGSARRLLLDFCGSVAFSALEQAELAIVITEIATNLARHTYTGGTINCHISPDKTNVTLIARDSGPGISNVPEALKDGYSTGGSLGGGLGAILRLSDSFSLETTDKGTTLKVTKSALSSKHSQLSISVQSRPHPASQVNGDGSFVCEGNDRSLFGVFDALGHGTAAYKTAEMLKHCLEELHSLPLAQIIELTHKRMLSSRGAVIFLASLNHHTAALEYISLGNIEGRLYSGSSYKKLTNQNGTVGITIPPVNVIRLTWQQNTALILTSDGINPNWNIENTDWCTAQLNKTSMKILTTWGRDNDDATVMIVRNKL